MVVCCCQTYWEKPKGCKMKMACMLVFENCETVKKAMRDALKIQVEHCNAKISSRRDTEQNEKE